MGRILVAIWKQNPQPMMRIIMMIMPIMIMIMNISLSSGGGGGREGGTSFNRIPKSVRIDEHSCQFIVELEDETSAKRVLANHKFVAHRIETKHKLSSTLRGHSGGAVRKIILKPHNSCEEPCQNDVPGEMPSDRGRLLLDKLWDNMRQKNRFQMPRQQQQVVLNTHEVPSIQPHESENPIVVGQNMNIF